MNGQINLVNLLIYIDTLNKRASKSMPVYLQPIVFIGIYTGGRLYIDMHPEGVPLYLFS